MFYQKHSYALSRTQICFIKNTDTFYQEHIYVLSRARTYFIKNIRIDKYSVIKNICFFYNNKLRIYKKCFVTNIEREMCSQEHRKRKNL